MEDVTSHWVGDTLFLWKTATPGSADFKIQGEAGDGICCLSREAVASCPVAFKRISISGRSLDLLVDTAPQLRFVGTLIWKGSSTWDFPCYVLEVYSQVYDQWCYKVSQIYKIDSWISPGSGHRSIALFSVTKLQIAMSYDQSTETQTENQEWPAGFPSDSFTAEPNVTPQIGRLVLLCVVDWV